MGFFWDLIQQSQISEQRERAGSLEQRIERLEDEVAQTRKLLRTLLERLERHLDEDVNKDGRVG